MILCLGVFGTGFGGLGSGKDLVFALGFVLGLAGVGGTGDVGPIVLVFRRAWVGRFWGCFWDCFCEASISNYVLRNGLFGGALKHLITPTLRSP